MTGTVQYRKLREDVAGINLKNAQSYKNRSNVDFGSLIVKALDGTSNQQQKPAKTESVDKQQEDNSIDKQEIKRTGQDTEKKDNHDLKPGEIVLVADLNTSVSTEQTVRSTDLEGIFQQSGPDLENQVHINTDSAGREIITELNHIEGRYGFTEDQPSQALDVNQPLITDQSLKSLRIQSGIGENADKQTDMQKNLEELAEQFKTEDAAGQKVTKQPNLISGSLRQAATDQDLLNVKESDHSIAEAEDTDGSELLLAENLRNQVNPQEVIKIKVAEPFRQISPAAAENIGNKITQKIMEGVQEFHIQLMPENLGKISIKISVLDTGIKVLLNCENPKTLGLLTDRSDVIAQIVERNTDTPVVVEVKEDNYWNQQKNATDQHKNQNQSGQQDHGQKKSDRAETSDFINQLRLGIYDNQKIV